MVEATTGWLETYPVPHATARNAILALENQILWRHGTPEIIESDTGTHFRNNLIDTWAKEWVYHIPCHAPASWKIERYNGLLKTTLRAMGAGTFKHWDTHLAKATWLVNTRGSANRAGPAQSKLLHTVEGDKVPLVHIKNMLGEAVWVTPASGKGKPIRGIAFAQGPGCTWWVIKCHGNQQESQAAKGAAQVCAEQALCNSALGPGSIMVVPSPDCGCTTLGKTFSKLIYKANIYIQRAVFKVGSVPDPAQLREPSGGDRAVGSDGSCYATERKVHEITSPAGPPHLAEIQHQQQREKSTTCPCRAAPVQLIRTACTAIAPRGFYSLLGIKLNPESDFYQVSLNLGQINLMHCTNTPLLVPLEGKDSVETEPWEAKRWKGLCQC
ncbi:hypothetical protein QYF61_022838 [Mycteria americana]|uniref:Integrase catalytic domain-containing protein n=1 Tax=Mycteria americana TaxID=33587 RepID=A0AAN7P1W8_MYCAM|nr:hypothetical protein QYF61_022838 [Mycteria americana]